MENETRIKAVRAGVILICLGLGLIMATRVLQALYPFIVSGDYEDIMSFNTTVPKLLCGFRCLSIAGLVLVAALVKNKVMVIACSAFALVKILNTIYGFVNGVPLIVYLIISVMLGCVALGAICSCEQMREHKRKLLIWCVSLYVATDVFYCWFPTFHITGNVGYELYPIITNLQVLEYVGLLFSVASCVAWIMFWLSIPKLFSASEEDDNTPLLGLILNRYSITFFAVEAVAFIIYNLVWKNIEI